MQRNSMFLPTQPENCGSAQATEKAEMCVLSNESRQQSCCDTKCPTSCTPESPRYLKTILATLLAHCSPISLFFNQHGIKIKHSSVLHKSVLFEKPQHNTGSKALKHSSDLICWGHNLTPVAELLQALHRPTLWASMGPGMQSPMA